ncbi:unnamed protein product [Linum tenue]|uniref:Bifunctional inhibitor/plant lipid transfer protein/seed storage helical domain-containing protein n=1 Tax=Linum tenue TaxID=586396 RepID=A0AAV0IED8_9ROSI|nr:unnamed protein product [Linum tenue]
MGSVRTFALFYFAALLVVHVDKLDAERRRLPLCASQFSLANYACGTLPFMQLPPPSSIPPPTPSEILFHLAATKDDSHGRDPTTGSREGGGALGGSDDHDDDQQKQQHRRHRNHRSPSSHHDGARRDRHKHRRGRHRNGHRGSRHDHEGDQRTASPAEANCCKWVGAVDDECVCELLFRLPTFLARPIHEYTIIVSEWCKITYTCGGRSRP